MNTVNQNRPPQGGNQSQGGQPGQSGGRRRRRRRGKGGGGQNRGDNQGQGQRGGPDRQRNKGHGGGPSGPHRGQQQPQQRGSQPQKPKVTPFEVRPPFREEPLTHNIKRYGVAFYQTFAEAKADIETIKNKASQFDQLNVVIKAEGDMDDPDLNAVEKVKVFAGAAWHLIHERRQEDGWYNEPR